MKKTIFFACIIFAAVAWGGYSFLNRDNDSFGLAEVAGTDEMKSQTPLADKSRENIMEIRSGAFSGGEIIPARYTCDGEGVNPDLEISSVPENAKSLVLIVDDPDAPMGNFNHWVVWNIDPAISRIEENSVPPGAVVGINDGEKNAYTPPCPPGGVHRYYFKVYALDTKLDISSASRKDDVERAITGHIVGEAELLGKYGR